MKYSEVSRVELCWVTLPWHTSHNVNRDVVTVSDGSLTIKNFECMSVYIGWFCDIMI